MPIRPPEHHNERRAHILDAAITCFSRSGFHGTSMAQIIAEAGVSAGAVYRYFPSKAELTVAAGQSVFMPARNQFSRFTSATTPVRPTTALAHVFEALVTRADTSSRRMTPLILEVWAEATRDAALQGPLTEVYDGIRGDVLTLVTRWQEAGHLSPSADTEGLASALAALMPGLLVARTVQGRTDALEALEAFGGATGL